MFVVLTFKWYASKINSNIKTQTKQNTTTLRTKTHLQWDNYLKAWWPVDQFHTVDESVNQLNNCHDSFAKCCHIFVIFLGNMISFEWIFETFQKFSYYCSFESFLKITRHVSDTFTQPHIVWLQMTFLRYVTKMLSFCSPLFVFFFCFISYFSNHFEISTNWLEKQFWAD